MGQPLLTDEHEAEIRARYVRVPEALAVPDLATESPLFYMLISVYGEDVGALLGELDATRRRCEGHAERIAKQSDQLSLNAEKAKGELAHLRAEVARLQQELAYVERLWRQEQP